MKYKVALLAALFMSLLVFGEESDRFSDDSQAPKNAGIDWAKDVRQLNSRARSANMTYHGGKIMTTAIIKSIFWGTTWGTYNGDKITGMDSWYNGFSGS